MDKLKGSNRAGFNWWEAWGPVYLGGTERLQQLYDENCKAKTSKKQNAFLF